MIGLTKEFVDESCPNDLEPYRIAHNLYREEQDEMAWISGMYIKSAFESVLASSFGRSGISYPEESIMAKMKEYEGMTQDEIDRIEIQKMINNDMAWSSQQKASGMKEAQV